MINGWQHSNRQTFAPELIRAFGHATGTAANRGLTEITLEDFLVGLRYALGRRFFTFFDDRQSVERLLSTISPKKPNLLRLFGLKGLAKRFPTTTKGQIVGYRSPFFDQSTALREVLTEAEQSATRRPHPQIGVDDVMQALANNKKSQKLLQEYGITIRSVATS